jgi:23S rRNA pseudouridine2605 synthase
MRLNKLLAQLTGISRRAADRAITEGRVTINGETALLGRDATDRDQVVYDGNLLDMSSLSNTSKTIIMFHKPVGYVVSRNGQGSRTIYDILPEQYHKLKPVGRLDKHSSGLLLLTDDGELAHELTHPSRQKIKVYEITLDKPLAPLHRQMISDHGIQLEDGPSKLQLERIHEGNDVRWRVTMHEGRNRQIRRTFASLGYDIRTLHRTQFGSYLLGTLTNAQCIEITHPY